MSRSVGIEIFYWLDNWTDDQASVFHKAAEAGYDGVEISFVAGLEMDTKYVARTAADLGLEVVCSTGLSEQLDISSADPSVREAGKNHIRSSAVSRTESGWAFPKETRTTTGLARRRRFTSWPDTRRRSTSTSAWRS